MRLNRNLEYKEEKCCAELSLKTIRIFRQVLNHFTTTTTKTLHDLRIDMKSAVLGFEPVTCISYQGLQPTTKTPLLQFHAHTMSIERTVPRWGLDLRPSHLQPRFQTTRPQMTINLCNKEHKEKMPSVERQKCINSVLKNM